MLGHVLDQDLFGDGLGPMVGFKSELESSEGGGVFPGQQLEVARETVAQMVAAGDLFPGVGTRTGGELGIGAIGGELSFGGHGRKGS